MRDTHAQFLENLRGVLAQTRDVALEGGLIVLESEASPHHL
jgi:hypothetical protein